MAKPYWQDKHRTLYNANCRDMSALPDESVQMCVTSPPYWGLRKYAGEQESIWGGTPECQHEWGEYKTFTTGRHDADRHKRRDNDGSKREVVKEIMSLTGPGVSTCTQGQFCSLCGAWRGAYGLEPTPQLYVAHTIEILREIRRVLRKDGVVFWNIDDSYAGSGGPGSQYDNKATEKGKEFEKFGNPNRAKFNTIKPKDLCLIPFRVAIAAQEDGWYVRSVIIWNKPNPMPESVTDRPTGSHEYILMLTKSAKYYWDMEAVREPHTQISLDRAEYENHRQSNNGIKSAEYAMPANIVHLNPAGRNLRDVWTFPTQPYPNAHFATYPEKLPELCIKAATPEVGCCSKCGKAWERVIQRVGGPPTGSHAKNHKQTSEKPWEGDSPYGGDLSRIYAEYGYAENKTIGWQPGCKCNADKVPSVVLDPFCGSGTTLEVAAKLNRMAIGYEISEEYCDLIIKRNNQSVLL